MIYLSYRDESLNPEEIKVKNKLMDQISLDSINDAWNEFWKAISDSVDDAVDSYINEIIKGTEEYKRKVELDKKWDALPVEDRQWNVQSMNPNWKNLSPEQQQAYKKQVDELSDAGIAADEEVEALKTKLMDKYDKVRKDMKSQLISWKVD